MVAVALPLCIGACSAGLVGALWGLGDATFTGILPTLYAHRLGRAAKLSGHSGKHPRLLVFAFVSLTTGLAVLLLADAPRDVLVVNAGLLAVLLVLTPITLLWDISIHVATISGATALSLLLVQPGLYVGAGLVLSVASVGWSRVHRQEHKPTQVIAGAAAGALACSLVYVVMT
ncbi:hypothetical protein [Nonomuraea sp. NPDC003754]